MFATPVRGRVLYVNQNMNKETLISAIPAVNTWIDKYIDRHSQERVKLIDAGHPRLSENFTPQLLNNSYYVLVSNIEAPPLAEFGLGELSFFEEGSFGGITFKDTFFVTYITESLCFHELIHVIQWDELGAEMFPLLYGAGLAQYGYRHSPLEEVAYSLQERFDRGENIQGLESIVRSHCRELANYSGSPKDGFSV